MLCRRSPTRPHPPRSDEVNRRSPTFWEDGAGIARLRTTVITVDGRPSWRIYEVLPEPRKAGRPG